MGTITVLLAIVIAGVILTLVVLGELGSLQVGRRARIEDEARLAQWRVTQVSQAAARAMMEEARKHLPER